MGKKKLLFSQQEMRVANRFRISRETLLKDRLNLDDGGLEILFGEWEKEKTEKNRIRRELVKEEKSRQLDLFPAERDSSLWQNSIKKISASKLSTYRGCPLSYYFHYIMHEQVPQSPSKIFGKEIHYIIQEFHGRNFKSSESFIKFWKHRWWGVVNGEYGDTDIKFKSKEQPGQLCGLGVKILKPFYEHNKKLPKPLMFEEDFSKYNKEFEGIKLIGKFDRVDEIDGKVIITDYKTDFFSPAQNTFLLHRHPQFTLYALAWYMEHGNIPNLALHHLRTGQVFKTKRTGDDFEYLRDVVSKTKSRILEGDFTPFYGFHCKGCDFMDAACRKNCVGVGSKLKKLEQEVDVKPEIDTLFSYDVPNPQIRLPDFKKYEKRGEFDRAYYSLSNYLRNLQCPLETKEGALACFIWDEESPISLPDPEIDS